VRIRSVLIVFVGAIVFTIIVISIRLRTTKSCNQLSIQDATLITNMFISDKSADRIIGIELKVVKMSWSADLLIIFDFGNDAKQRDIAWSVLESHVTPIRTATYALQKIQAFDETFETDDIIIVHGGVIEVPNRSNYVAIAYTDVSSQAECLAILVFDIGEGDVFDGELWRIIETYAGFTSAHFQYYCYRRGVPH